MKRTLWITTVGLVLGAMILSGCGAQTAEVETKTAELVYPNWAESVAYTHLAEVVLEDMMGYECEITAADVAPGYAGVAQGGKDAFMECWRLLHKDYLDRYGDDLVSLGNIFEGTQVGLAVPSYVTIDKLSELEAHADKFGGKITGIDAGAGMMKKTENELIPAYGLESIELMASSGPAMTAALKDAVEKKEWIVVTSWKPHWMFGRWDLKFLEQDEDKIMWESGDIEIIARADLAEEKPELAQFLENMYLTDSELADLMIKVKDSDEDIYVVVRQWMKDNEEVVKAWIPSS